MLVLLLAMILAADGPPTYERDIRPILARRCVACHQAKKVENADISGGLALDSFDAVSKGVGGRAVVVAGDSAKSPIFARLRDPDEDKRMPLLDEPIGDRDRDLIRRWIDGGAVRGETASETATEETKPTRRPIATRDVSIAIELPGGPDVLLVKVGPLPAVTAVALSPDARFLAVGTDGRVVLWNTADRQPAATVDAPGAVHALAFSRDGRRLAIGSGLPARTGSVRIITVPDGAIIHDLKGHSDAVYAVAFRPDGAQLASAGFDSTVRLWNLADGTASGVYAGHSDFVHGLAYAPDGKSLLSASRDRSVKRFDATTREGLRTYGDGEQDVLAVAFKPDGTGFVSAGEEPRIRWWRNEAERASKKVTGHNGPIFALAFSEDGKTLISASGDSTVRLWDGASGAAKKTLPGATEWQYAATLSRDGALAAAGGWDGLARVWDAQSGKLLVTLMQPPGGWLAAMPTGEVTGSADVLNLSRRKRGGPAR